MINSNSPDIVIFTNGNLFSRIILDKFLTKYQPRISMVVIVTCDYYGNKGLRALFEYSKLTSWLYVFYKIWTLMMIRMLRIGNKTAISSVSQLCNSIDVPYCFSSDINELSLYEHIKKLFPKYLVSVSCPQLIQQKWLKLFEGKGMNIHSSLLPQYAGLAPYFWVLVNGEKVTGTTVHYLVRGFDKGNVLCQAKIGIDNGISSFRLFIQLCLAGQNILLEAFDKMLKDNSGEDQDHSSFTYFSHPTTKAYIKLKRNGFALFNFADFKHVRKYI